MKTIKQIATAANVSKMKVRRYIEKWNIVPEQTGTVFWFSDTVANEIISALLLNKVERVPEQTGTKVERNVTKSEQSDTLVTVIEMLKKELESKGNQLKIKDKQIDDLNERLAYEQKLNEHSQILLKQEQDKNILLLDMSSDRKTFFQKLFKK